MGVEAFRAFLEQSESVIGPDDQEFAERYAELLLTTMTTGGDFGLGFAAALANWLAIGRHSSQPIQTWIPLYTPPRHRIVNDGDYYEPPARSLLFELDGAAVCVTEELAAYRFGPSDVDDIDVDDVRERGKPISRERFEELRSTEAPTIELGGEHVSR
jgi:hypothetical protein